MIWLLTLAAVFEIVFARVEVTNIISPHLPKKKL
jgi:hypothetical protein